MKRRAVLIWLGVLLVAALVSVVVGLRVAGPNAAADHGAGDGSEGHDETATSHDMQNMFPTVEEVYDEVTSGGVKVEFTVKSEDFFNGPTSVASGGLATVKLRLRDAASDAALTDVTPRAWIDTSASKDRCDERVASWVRGQLTDRPLVDLDGAFVLTLDETPTISVIDPLVNLAGLTQLYAQVQLPAPGGDWVLAPAGDRLYVSLPSLGQIAVVATDSFRVESTIDIGGAPGAMSRTPDGRQLWAIDGNTATVIDVAGASVSDRLTIGASVAPAFSRDGRSAYVANGVRLEAVDTGTLRPVADTDLPAPVATVAGSPADGTVYVGLTDGSVHVLDGGSLVDRGAIQTGDGVRTVRFSPDGHWAVAVGRARRAILIDATRRAVAAEVTLDLEPGEVLADDRAVYVRASSGGKVDMIDLGAVGDGRPVAATTIEYAPSAAAGGSTRRVSMATFAGEDAVLVTDEANGSLSFLPHGAAQPSGSFALSSPPRGVLALPRGFRQEAPGVYTARFRVPSAGSFDVGVLLDRPRVVHCFGFDAAGTTAEATSLAVALATGGPPVVSGASVGVPLRVSGPDGAGVPGLRDLTVSISQIGGNWSDRTVAVDRGGGDYAVAVRVPAAGRYQLAFSVPSRGLGSDRFDPAIVQAAS